MKEKDCMPSKDGDFDILQNNVYSVATSRMSEWLIPQELLTALDASRQRWITAYAAYCNPAMRTPGVTREKNDAKAACRSVLRTFIQGQIMHNPRVADAAHPDMGLPVYDRTPTQATPPRTRTEMEIRFAQMLEHIVHVRDSESQGAGKPLHVIGFELWRRIGGDMEPAFEEMQLVELATRLPHTLNYSSAERGRMVWYASRWVNTRGEKGPWREIVSAIVP